MTKVFYIQIHIARCDTGEFSRSTLCSICIAFQEHKRLIIKLLMGIFYLYVVNLLYDNQPFQYIPALPLSRYVVYVNLLADFATK